MTTKVKRCSKCLAFQQPSGRVPHRVSCEFWATGKTGIEQPRKRPAKKRWTTTCDSDGWTIVAAFDGTAVDVHDVVKLLNAAGIEMAAEAQRAKMRGSDAATERRAMTIEEKLLVLETAIAATQVTPEDADTIKKRLTIFASNLHHRGAKWRTADVLEFVLAELARQAEAHAARIDDYQRRLQVETERVAFLESEAEEHERELIRKLLGLT